MIFDMAEQENSARQALAQYESIANYIAAWDFADAHQGDDLTDADVIAEMDEDEREELERLLAETDFSAEDLSDPDAIRERIEEDPLSIEVRGDWHTPGDEDGNTPTEYKILLCTGGPACQIIGDLDQYGQPKSARLMHQDWFKPWEEQISGVAQSTLERYASFFYFGDGDSRR
jgi:hypothetical protein